MNGTTWLLRLDLPGGSVFLSDGGVTTWGGNTYRANDAVLGSFATLSDVTVGFGPELPEQEIIFAVPDNAAVEVLQAGARARSVMRLSLVEFDASTGQVVGSPHHDFFGRMDRVRHSFAFQQLSVILTCVPELEVMLFSDDGNGLSAASHKELFPGETGHDQATGLVIPVAWGVEAARGVSSGGGGGGDVPNRNVDFR